LGVSSECTVFIYDFHRHMTQYIETTMKMYGSTVFKIPTELTDV
jgi:hypothetical protein